MFPPIHSPTHIHFETSYPSHTQTNTPSPPAYLHIHSHVGFLTEWSCQGNGEEMTQGIFSQISPVGIFRSGTGPVSGLSPQFSHQTQSECQTHWDTLVRRQEGKNGKLREAKKSRVKPVECCSNSTSTEKSSVQYYPCPLTAPPPNINVKCQAIIPFTGIVTWTVGLRAPCVTATLGKWLWQGGGNQGRRSARLPASLEALHWPWWLSPTTPCSAATAASLKHVGTAQLSTPSNGCNRHSAVRLQTSGLTQPPVTQPN